MLLFTRGAHSEMPAALALIYESQGGPGVKGRKASYTGSAGATGNTLTQN